MGVTSLLNSNSVNYNAKGNRFEHSNGHQNQQPETGLLHYSKEMIRDINSAPLQPSDFESLWNSLLSLEATNQRLPAVGASPLEQGTLLALINSQETSAALETMSNRSTLVPHPIDCQSFAVNLNTATNRSILSLTPCLSSQNRLPSLILLPAPQPLTQQAQLRTVSPSPAHLPLPHPESDITYLGSGQQPLQTQQKLLEPHMAQS
ncbi:uncharacterized protein PGTG_04741 [Puccinia graminis f. sp. tritici CRL 75-36-700-3]|uniref:Uncharacterized protein n=1 Tax=Puccinia graminis f. sp. tritici (strain CRL 75-36-700-3 / race SCCL) TaxID=418459 RepID=E3K3Y3_PUCGT|nr:uncharacterized protein PGTG_04741 [Puccinia graminis f. sp. tritici CRL 75-36-700-3]EFP78785.2 hypothetical protein PGTG_04741 [Puccinia graminis f. sp. tritici CRL 75-36-700-3]